jgi:TolA-binding protein
MKPRPDPLDAAAQALRELMAAPADGRITRARVLCAVSRRTRGRELRRPLGLLLLAAVVASSTVSVAWTALRRRPPPPLVVPPLPDAYAAVAASRRSVPAVQHALAAPPPPPLPEAVPPTDSPDEESASYGRAHRAHFDGAPPAHALAAWDEYLRRFPRGAFVPEARYNRALCLVRLGHHAAAARALRPIARGFAGGYRRKEACALLGWLHQSGTAVGDD